MSLVFALERFDERNKSQHKSDLDEQAVQVTPKICQSVEVHTYRLQSNILPVGRKQRDFYSYSKDLFNSLVCAR